MTKQNLSLLVLFIIIATFFSSCKNNKKENSKVTVSSWIGNYVTQEYHKRQDGYDWTVVSIEALTDSTCWITIQSRSDIKKPTCSFESEAKILSNEKLMATYENKEILFHKQNNEIAISTIKEEDKNLLYYFCSGGASISGEYIYLNEPLDKEQLKQKDTQ